MAEISVTLEVLNPMEVVKEKKGRLLGSLVSFWVDEDEMRTRIEEEICREIVVQLRQKLKERLEEEGVIAHLHIETKA